MTRPHSVWAERWSRGEEQYRQALFALLAELLHWAEAAEVEPVGTLVIVTRPPRDDGTLWHHQAQLVLATGP